MFDSRIFAQRLLALRKSRNLSQREVAEAVGATKVFICDIEKSRRTTTLDKAVALADYFDVSLDYLVGRSDNPARH